MAAAATDLFKKLTNNFSTTLSGAIVGAGDTSMSLGSTTNLASDTGIVLVVDRVNASGVATPLLREYIKGTVSGSTIINLVRGVGNSTAQAHLSGAVVEQVVDQNTINDISSGILVHSNQDGTLKVNSVNTTQIADTSITFSKLSNDATYAWGSWTPVLTAATGTLTTTTVNSASYKQIGKTVSFQMDASITNAGTGGNGFNFTLPTIPLAGKTPIFAGREDGISGKMLQGKTSGGTTVSVFIYDNTTPITTGAVIRMTGTYETT